jgi:hypothetical protein
MLEMNNLYKNLAGKPEDKRLLARPRYGREHDFRLYLRERAWVWTEFLISIHGPEAGCCENGSEFSGYLKGW